MAKRKKTNIDWSCLDRDVQMSRIDCSEAGRAIAHELLPPLPDTRIPAVRLAQELERKMFTFMLLAGISKVYVWSESSMRGNVCSLSMRFDDVRPSTQCTEHDYKYLLEMPDEEFNALPPSPNTGLVKSWREMMRNRK